MQEFGKKLQSLPRSALFIILLLCTTIPLFIPNFRVPNKPVDPSIDMYGKLMALPEGSTILIASDWTISTRGESGGQFETIMRILMRRGIRFAIYSSADPQAPQVARDAIMRVNEERAAAGERRYEQWTDYLVLGFLPNAEAVGQAIANNVRLAFPGRKGVPPGEKHARDVFESPVLREIHTVGDFGMALIITASRTSVIAIERFYGKVPIGLSVTGVMGPESLNYYETGQVVGLVNGLKGLLDLETLMEVGVNWAGSPNTIVSDKYPEGIAGFPGQRNSGKGTQYYPTLTVALFLIIGIVILGNIGMFMSKGVKR